MAPTPTNRNRRVTDKDGGLLDAAQQAVRLERLFGQHELLSARLSGAMENVSNILAAVQLEVRGCSNKVEEISGLRHSHDTSQEAIAEVRQSIREMSSRLDGWFEDFEGRSTQRWEKFERERNEWRLRHEAENEDAHRESEKEIRSVRETMIRWGGVVFGLGLVATIAMTLGMYALNQRFDAQSASLIGVRNDFGEYRNLSEQRYDERVRKIHEIELYLSRGGRIPAEPYVPSTQRERNAQRQPAN